MNKYGISIDEMLNILNKKSGILGISGVGSDFRALEKLSLIPIFFARAGERDASGRHDVGGVGDLERHVRVLLDEQNGYALVVDLTDDLKDIAHLSLIHI